MKVHRQLTGIGLARFGFIHVTGLDARLDGQHWRIMFDPNKMILGTWNRNRDMMMIITWDGEIWLRKETTTPFLGNVREYMDLQRQLAPNQDVKMFVPCTNGDAIPSHALMSRVADPYWVGRHKEYEFHVPETNFTDTHLFQTHVTESLATA